MACDHDQRTAYIQGARPKRGFNPVGLVCVKCWRFRGYRTLPKSDGASK